LRHSLSFSYVLADALLIPDMASTSLLVRSVLLLIALFNIWLVFGRSRNVLLMDLLMPVHDLIATLAWFELLKRSHSPDVPTFVCLAHLHRVCQPGRAGIVQGRGGQLAGHFAGHHRQCGADESA
jgi:hypothetical protein